MKTRNYAMNKGKCYTEGQQIIQVCDTYILLTFFNDSSRVFPFNGAGYVVADIITAMNNTWSLLFTL
jgi:hypothetical protein